MASPRVLLAALVTLVLLAPASQGAYSFGSIVDKNDFDFQPVPSVRTTTPAAGKWVLPCFGDTDGNGIVNDQESVYLAVLNGLAATCNDGNTNTKNVRLTPVGSLAAGTEVKAADPDAGTRLTQLGTVAVPGHAVRVVNVDLATTVRKADTVYLDLMGSGSATPQVGIGDLRLSAFGAHKAGTRVQAGDADYNMYLQEFNGGAPKSLYTVNMVYEFGKGWYLNADLDAAAGGAVEEGDVRLTASVPNPLADVAANIGNPGQTVDGLSLSPDVARPGQLVLATVTVKNPTAKVGSGLVQTKVDGVVVDARGTPTLAQNEVSTLVVPFFAPQEPGRHKVQSGEYTFFLDVEAPAIGSPSAPAPVTTQGEVAKAASVGAAGPMPLTLLALVAVGALLLRRRQ